MTVAAEYTSRSKRTPPLLTINRIENGQRFTLFAQNVSGKREARVLAKEHGATPWNF